MVSLGNESGIFLEERKNGIGWNCIACLCNKSVESFFSHKITEKVVFWWFNQ